MKYKKKLFAIGIIGALLLSLAGCGESESTTYEPINDEDETVYHIAMIADDDTSYYDTINQGFLDALSDLFGDSHLDITYSVTEDTQLIFTNGSNSLTTYAESDTETPIVAAAIMDYQSLLHITISSDDTWDQTTGTNITGVSSTPNLANQVSLLIETTDPLESVGLLYTPSDEDALYQLATIEQYLDQAGIPWKEYALPLASSTEEEATTGEEANTEEETSSSSATVISPSKTVAPSLTEGSYDEIDIFGEPNLSGLISPSSAHTAGTSDFWTEELSTANADVEVPESDDLEGILNYAANECSAFFITTGSLLEEEIETIVSIATAAGVTTVSGDETLGAYTLTCSYQDSYAQGYAAGKLVYRILVDGENPGEIEITTTDAETVKLYNGDLAETFGIEFPKSFSEITEFLETYETGSSTDRITSEDE